MAMNSVLTVLLKKEYLDWGGGGTTTSWTRGGGEVGSADMLGTVVLGTVLVVLKF